MGKKERRRALWDYLGKVPDHRERQGRRYELRSVLAMAIAAVLAGRQSLAAIARWAEGLRGKEELLQFGVERRKTPCHATFHYVFKGLNAKALERALSAWVRALGDEGPAGHTALDGKVLRGSKCGEYPGVALISAYCEALGGVVAQLRVPSETNEITVALKLLKEVPLEGMIVTGDAIYAQKRICREIIDGGGDYFIAVKKNQPELLDDIEAAFAKPDSPLRSQKASA